MNIRMSILLVSKAATLFRRSRISFLLVVVLQIIFFPHYAESKKFAEFGTWEIDINSKGLCLLTKIHDHKKGYLILHVWNYKKDIWQLSLMRNEWKNIPDRSVHPIEIRIDNDFKTTNMGKVNIIKGKRGISYLLSVRLSGKEFIKKFRNGRTLYMQLPKKTYSIPLQGSAGAMLQFAKCLIKRKEDQKKETNPFGDVQSNGGSQSNPSNPF